MQCFSHQFHYVISEYAHIRYTMIQGDLIIQWSLFLQLAPKIIRVILKNQTNLCSCQLQTTVVMLDEVLYHWAMVYRDSQH